VASCSAAGAIDAGRSRSRAGRLALRASEPIRRLLDITGLTDHFVVESPTVKTAEAREDIVRLSVPAALEYVRIVRLTGSGVASRLGFDIEEIENLRVAVDELASVAIEAANAPMMISQNVTHRTRRASPSMERYSLARRAAETVRARRDALSQWRGRCAKVRDERTISSWTPSSKPPAPLSRRIRRRRDSSSCAESPLRAWTGVPHCRSAPAKGRAQLPGTHTRPVRRTHLVPCRPLLARRDRNDHAHGARRRSQ
jgi:hypothetical protein